MVPYEGDAEREAMKGYGENGGRRRADGKMRFCLFAAAIFFAGLLPCGCGYVPRYDFSDCAVTENEPLGSVYIAGYRPGDAALRDFTKTAEEAGLTFYVETGVGLSAADGLIDETKLVLDAFGENGLEFPFDTVYVGGDFVSRYNFERELWLNEDADARTIAAVCLERTAGKDAPFGIYAGMAAAVLRGREDDFPELTEGELKEAVKALPHCTELQYPLYDKSYADEAEYAAAWNFSRAAVSACPGGLSEWLQKSSAEWEAHLEEAFGVRFPEYRIEANDSHYVLRAETENFICYIRKGYRDGLLPAGIFSMKYEEIRRLLTDADEVMRTAEERLGSREPDAKVQVYLGQDLPTTSDGRGGQAAGIAFSGTFAVCRSVAVFAHELMHTVMSRTPTRGEYLEEIICDYFARRAFYPSAWLYCQYAGEAETEGNYGDAKAINAEARERYGRAFGKADLSSFRAEAWTDCVAAAVNRLEENFAVNGQWLSFTRYVSAEYGFEKIAEVHAAYREDPSDADVRSLAEEWREWLGLAYPAE